jgi:hypothetical protein
MKRKKDEIFINLVSYVSLDVPRKTKFMPVHIHYIAKDYSLSVLFITICQSRWPRSLRLGFAVVLLLGLLFRIPPGHGCLVYCECCVLSVRGLCVGLITHPGESHRVWRV